MPASNSIVIVNHECRDGLRALLHSLKMEETLDTEVIVVDNASFDGSADMVAQDFPNVLLVRRDSNCGFAAGANAGVDQSHGDVVVICHSEIVASAHTLAELADRVREGSGRKVGAIVPRLLDREQHDLPVAGPFPGIRLGITGALSPQAGRKMFIPYLEHATDAEWALMKCVAVSRGVFDVIGGFDEQFFLYYHDADFSRRLYNKQFRILFDHEISVIDASDQSKTIPAHLLRIIRKDQEKFLAKHLPGWQYKFVAGVRGLIGPKE